MSGLILLSTQALLYFGVMAVLFRLRHLMGLGVFLCALGVMHFLETYLAAVFFIELPFGLISPGSTVLFSGKLAIILLLYIREDAETVRQPIYGLLVGNFLMVALVLSLRLYGPSAALPGYNPDLTLIDQLGVLMIWGTSLLFIDSVALILLYERLRRKLPGSVVLRSFVSLAVILSFDQIAFFTVLSAMTGTPATALVGGWIAKMGAAAGYSVLMAAYLGLFERDPITIPVRSLRDVFSTLTYRHPRDAQAEREGRDAVTGVLIGKSFQAIGQASLLRGLATGKPVSIEMVAIDRFPEIVATQGQAAADEILRHVADQIRLSTRANDQIFRHDDGRFIVLCETMSHNTALGHASRLGRAVNKAAGHGRWPAPTVSIGIATYPDDAGTILDLLRHAETHVVTAQHLGVGTVVGNRGSARIDIGGAVQAPS
jgi:diguanylate cyclase (GGDEF)-like protein